MKNATYKSVKPSCPSYEPSSHEPLLVEAFAIVEAEAKAMEQGNQKTPPRPNINEFCCHCGRSWREHDEKKNDKNTKQWKFNHVLTKQYSFVMGKVDEYKILLRELRHCESKMRILKHEIADVLSTPKKDVEKIAEVTCRLKIAETENLEKTRKTLNDSLSIYEDLDYTELSTKYEEYLQSAQRFIDKVGLDVTARILADPDEFADFFEKCVERFEDCRIKYFYSITPKEYYPPSSWALNQTKAEKAEMDDLVGEINRIMCHVPTTRYVIDTMSNHEQNMAVILSNREQKAAAILSRDNSMRSWGCTIC
jgi:hypothetical protein